MGAGTRWSRRRMPKGHSRLSCHDEIVVAPVSDLQGGSRGEKMRMTAGSCPMLTI